MLGSTVMNRYDQLPGSKRSGSFFVILIICSILAFNCAEPAIAQNTQGKWELWCTNPWIGLVAGFVGGVHVNVHVIMDWDHDGDLHVMEDPGEIPREGRVLAMDREDPFIPSGNSGKELDISFLYSFIPMERSRLNILFSDPASLPFIAQRVLTSLSYFDPIHYSYYQRRLAEFQSRLESTVLVGRRLLDGVQVLDISLYSQKTLQAAGCSITEPKADFWDLLDSPESVDLYTAEFNDHIEKGLVVVADFWTPRPIRDFMTENDLGVVFPKPDFREDLFLSWHMKYLSIWNKTN